MKMPGRLIQSGGMRRTPNAARLRCRVLPREAFGVRGIPVLSFSFFRRLNKQAISGATAAISIFSFAARADLNQTVGDLVPRLAGQPGEERYAARMELQAMAASASRPGADEERRTLATLLATKAIDTSVPQPARVWFVRQLELIGDGSSVTELGPLLFDKDVEIRDCERRALERNSSPAAASVLRGALQKCSTSQEAIGFISSLGQRADADAVELIAPYLKQKETASIAASALGKIANDKAVELLWHTYDDSSAVAADALVLAGDQLLARGERDKAAGLYELLFREGKENTVEARCAAIMGVAQTDPKVARLSMFIESGLRDPHPRLQAAAASAALIAFGEEGAKPVLCSMLPNVSESAKICAIRVLGASAEKEIIAMAESDSEPAVRAAALEKLGQIGSRSSLHALGKAAADGSAEERKAATAALARISAPGVAKDLANLASPGETKYRIVAINALASRNDKSAVPAMLKYAAEPEPSIHRAACSALTSLGSDTEIEPLAHLVLETGDSDAQTALQHLAAHAADKHAAAVKIATMMRSVPPPSQPRLFETFTVLGGPESLAVITSAIFASQQPDTKEAAFRALANWLEFSATAPLLALAADTNTSRTHNVLAIQAVVRLVKASEREPVSARLNAATAAMNASRRDEEKKLVLSAYASVPSLQAAESLKQFLTKSPFQTDAGLASLNLAQTLLTSDKSAAFDLARAVRDANISPDLSRRAEELLKKQ
ncbi:MAG: hypothetical protein C5B50_16480 [Verrucomicrobia bacterium]|nr:MAG: hypothetical protein C5B50_16480 [Verrucomicrobiota bacterium]